MPDDIQSTTRRDAILDDALQVFGRFGYRKTSMQDIAAAADLSKQGLYLHFAGKDAIFSAAMEKYLSDALERVQALLHQGDAPLNMRLEAAMQAWFGRHLATFTPEAFDVIAAGGRLSPDRVENAQSAFKRAISEALGDAGFAESAASDRAEVLFLSGLSWKQPGTTPETFRAAVETCVRVCGARDQRTDPKKV